ncbi:MAG: aromatic acid decarboxylase [Planctomycetes bacterium]|nr:aromatic acid decarboxylase [Planctomycetota bacterium]
MSPAPASVPDRVCLAVSGASGSLYAIHTLRMLVQAGIRVDLIVSPSAVRVLHEETDFRYRGKPADLLAEGQDASLVTIHKHGDIGAPPASGTSLAPVMLVVPCSLTTVAGIAAGSAGNLIERAAQVALKEGRKLIIVPRETPLSRTHLDRLSALAWAGATILPAAPGFYHRPQTIEDLVDHVCAKILGVCGIPQDRVRAWDGGSHGEE